MRFLGNPYKKGNSQEIVSKKIESSLVDTLGAGLAVSLDPSDNKGETVILFDGTKPFYGITGWDKKAVCLSKNDNHKSIVLEGLEVLVVLSAGTVATGDIVYLQADGTFAKTDATFGGFQVVSIKETAKDWDDTQKDAVAVNITRLTQSATV